MRSDNQAKDLHYFHLYAVRDRVDLSGTSEEPPSLDPDIHVKLSELLPTEDDIKQMKSNFVILISRQLVQYLPFFKEHFSDVLTHHIPHIYDAEMKEVSEVVRSIICYKLIINDDSEAGFASEDRIQSFTEG